MIIVFIFFLTFCFSIFLVCYVCIFVFSKKKYEFVKNNLYLIIPVYCVFCWALYFIIFVNFLLSDYVAYDFTNYYYCGERVLKKPSDLYKKDIEHGLRYGYKYLPNFAVIIGVPLYLIPSIEIAYKIFYVINIILGMIFTVLFNKVLYLLNLKKKVHRFLFLIVISNGWLVLQLFRNNQTKYFICVILLFTIKRELQFKENQIEKDFKYYLIHYNLFVFIVGMFPYFIFYFLIYIFQDISKNDLFKKDNIKKYCIIIISFIVQNFLFIIAPDLIFDYIEVYQIEARRVGMRLEHFYLLFFEDYLDSLPKIYHAYITITLNIILFFIVFLLIIIRRLKLEEKFGLLSISIIFLNYVAYRISLILLPLICLLFIPHLDQNEKGIEFIKRNKIIIIGLLSIFGLYITPTKDDYNYPYFEGVLFLFIIFVSILGVCLLILYLKKFSYANDES